MAKYLVLLEHGLQDESVIEELRELDGAGTAFHLLVPARPVSDADREFIELEMSDDAGIEGDEAAVLASWRLRTSVAQLQDSGFAAHVEGEVGRADPIDAVDDAMGADAYDRVVVVTSRSGIAGWLHLDTASRIERKLDVPVTHLEGNLRQRT
jgi:hypothetical protein